jgi:multiple sugar transport system permease protein
MRRSRKLFVLGLVLPAVVFMVLVHLLPMAGGFYLSFKNLNTFTFSRLFDAPWAGLENYRTILFDAESPLRSGFVTAAGNTAVYTVATVVGTIGGGLAVALLLNRKMRGIKAIRTLMLAPWIVPSFVVAVLWQYMWQSDIGIINKVLVDYTGLLSDRPVWLLGPNSLWAIIIPSIWRGLPFCMLIFLAGLQAMPQELHEAAAIDGAGPWRRFRHITLPCCAR